MATRVEIMQLIQNLKSSDLDIRKKSLEDFLNFIKDEDDCRVFLMKKGFLLLVNILKIDDETVKISAVNAVKTLIKYQSIKDIISKNEIPSLIILLEHGDVELKKFATQAVKDFTKNKDGRNKILTANGLSFLITLLVNNDQTIKEFSIEAIQNLTVNDNCQEKINGRIIDVVDFFVRNDDENVILKALIALRNLSLTQENLTLIGTIETIEKLYNLLKNDHTQEHAAALLQNLALEETCRRIIRTQELRNAENEDQSSLLKLTWNENSALEIKRHCTKALYNLGLTTNQINHNNCPNKGPRKAPLFLIPTDRSIPRVTQPKLRNHINYTARSSMFTAYSAFSRVISGGSMGAGIGGIVSNNSWPLHLSFGIMLLGSLLKLMRLVSLRDDNRRLRHYFFAQQNLTGDTQENVKTEWALALVGPLVGVSAAVVGIIMLSQVSDYKNPNGNSNFTLKTTSEIFSVVAPFVVEVLSSLGEDLLNTSNSKLNDLFDLRKNISFVDDDGVEELRSDGANLDELEYGSKCCL